MNSTQRPARLSAAEAGRLVAELDGWRLSADGTAISRRYAFPDFEATMAFVNRLAYLANADDHHPDLKVGYGYCEVLFTTHDAGGLTSMDARSARGAQRLADELAAGPQAARFVSWDEVPDEVVNPSMIRRIVTGERLTVARMRFKDGFRVPQHRHVHEQFTQVTSGILRFWFGADRSQVLDVGPGQVVVIPSNLPHEALCIGDVEETDIWTPRREDWLQGTDAYLRG
jgi:pterin-4a-carbinolamine dehydratase/quercetin dioxygenase-like cupin family protein